MKIIYRILILLFLLSCKTQHFDKSLGRYYPIPPNCILIAENFYADKTEITNHSYREYGFWIKRVFGENSPEFKATAIDTSVWNEISGLENLSKLYHIVRKYDNHPVVGITLEQAKAFTDWRSDSCLLYTSPSPRDATLSRMPSSA